MGHSKDEFLKALCSEAFNLPLKHRFCIPSAFFIGISGFGMSGNISNILVPLPLAMITVFNLLPSAQTSLDCNG